MTTREILLLGLPESGKTTYLAALWHLLQQDDMQKKLTLIGWPDTRDYLNKLAQKWTRFVSVGRNLLSEDIQKINFSLKGGDNIVDLHVPDISGESWDFLWGNRSCSGDFASLVKDAYGILLFVHADRIRQPVDIMTVNKQASAAPSCDTAELKPWDPKESPTEVVLVDLLQALYSSPSMGRERRVAVVISAWDKVACMGQTPDQFILSALPMLYQFLTFCGQCPSFRIYGVSALGGDLEVPEDLERLMAQDKPAERVLVDDGENRCHDLTIPIHWLISGDD